MQKEILKEILREYENKQISAQLRLEEKKKQIYSQIPELSEIENMLNTYAIQTAKLALSSDSKINLDDFSSRISKLKEKKTLILKEHRSY